MHWNFLRFLCLGEWEEVLGGPCIAEGMKDRNSVWEPLGDDRDIECSRDSWTEGSYDHSVPKPPPSSSLSSSPESLSAYSPAVSPTVCQRRHRTQELFFLTYRLDTWDSESASASSRMKSRVGTELV